MTYPVAYCVKCKAHTQTLNRHTVLLSNKARALRGTCPVCRSENYKILPSKSKDSGLGPMKKTAVPTLLPTTMIAHRFSYKFHWPEWVAYGFFALSCMIFVYVLSLRF